MDVQFNIRCINSCKDVGENYNYYVEETKTCAETCEAF